MSASASKKKRQVRNEDGLTERQVASRKAQEEQKKKKLPTVLFLVAAVLAVAIIIGLAFLSKAQTNARYDAEMKPSYDTALVAATVGDESITVPLYNYFYYQTVNNNFSSFANYGLLQYDVPLSEQTVLGTTTAEDQFIDMTNRTVQQYLNIYAEAKENGYTLSDEEQAEIEESISTIRKNVESAGYYSFNYFLYLEMGEGCNEDNYRQFMTLARTVEGYEAAKEAEFEPTAEEIAAEYAENADAYDLIYFDSYEINAESSEETVEADEDNAEPHTHTVYTEEALAAAKAAADAAEQSFPAEAEADSGNQASMTSEFSEEVAAWALSAERQQGEVKSFQLDEEGQRYVVLRFDHRDTNDYFRPRAYVMRLPISTTTDENGNEVSTADTVAANANDIIAAMEPDMTEEALDALVTERSIIGAAYSAGKNTFGEEITAFLYDPARQANDTETFVIDNIYYIVRFLGLEEDNYQTVLVRNALHEAAESAWNTEVSERNEIEVNEDALKYAHTDLTIRNPYSLS